MEDDPEPEETSCPVCGHEIGDHGRDGCLESSEYDDDEQCSCRLSSEAAGREILRWRPA